MSWAVSSGLFVFASLCLVWTALRGRAPGVAFAWLGAGVAVAVIRIQTDVDWVEFVGAIAIGAGSLAAALVLARPSADGIVVASVAIALVAAGLVAASQEVLLHLAILQVVSVDGTGALFVGALSAALGLAVAQAFSNGTALAAAAAIGWGLGLAQIGAVAAGYVAMGLGLISFGVMGRTSTA